MSEQPQHSATVFLQPSHQFFVDNGNDTVLNRDVMRQNIGHQITGAFVYLSAKRWSYILKSGVVGVILGGLSIPLLAMLSIGVIRIVIRDGLPYWGVALYDSCLGLVIIGPLLICAWVSIVAFKQALNQLRLIWSKDRIEALLQKLVQEGLLIRGQILASKPNRNKKWGITYRFTTPSGKSLKRVFYPAQRHTIEVGTPVWVLYLNDKISVLL